MPGGIRVPLVATRPTGRGRAPRPAHPAPRRRGAARGGGAGRGAGRHDGRVSDPMVLRAGLVDEVCRAAGPISARVVDALRAVPRHLFLPEVPPEQAYRDDAIVTKRDSDGTPISSSSQPTIMAVMLDQLAPEPGHRILEIGAGTGYNAALLAHLVAPDGDVVSVDIDADLVERAADGLGRAGYPGVTLVRGDGGLGVPARAPFDRIIATVGVWDLAPAWLDQLSPAGRLVVPLDLGGVQCSVAFERDGGRWTSRSVVACGFMRLRGAFAGPERFHLLDRAAHLFVLLPLGGQPDRATILTALLAPAVERLPATGARPADMFGGLGLWLAAHEPRWCLLNETGPAGEAGTGRQILPPTPVQIQDQRLTAGILARDGIALLGADPDHGTVALGYGVGGSRLAGDLVEHVQAWDRAGRPGVEGMRVEAYPRTTAEPRSADTVMIEKTHTRLVLSWPG